MRSKTSDAMHTQTLVQAQPSNTDGLPPISNRYLNHMGSCRILWDVHVSCITCMRLETHLKLIIIFSSNVYHIYLLVSFIKIPGVCIPGKQPRTVLRRRRSPSSLPLNAVKHCRCHKMPPPLPPLNGVSIIHYRHHRQVSQAILSGRIVEQLLLKGTTC